MSQQQTIVSVEPAKAGAASCRYWHPLSVDPGAKAASIRRILALAREHLAMELGYFGTFDGGVETYQVVEGDASHVKVVEGSTLQLEQTLCWQVVLGKIGNVVPDTRRNPITRDLGAVRDGGVASYVGVPVHRDSELFGMLCLVSSEARPSFAPQDVAMLRLLAQLVALELSPDANSDEGSQRDLEALRTVLDPASRDLVIVYQPVARLAPQLRGLPLQVKSVEALSRFQLEPLRPVEYWFDLGWRNGLGVDLELAAIERAFAALPLLPEPIRLAVNVSPETLASARLRELIPASDAHRVTVELTEHVLLDDYDALRPALERVREVGVSLAIDDLGTGFSNLQHIIELAPEVIKADISITEGIESDPRRRALISALVAFAKETRINLVTEGVETAETARALVDLGVEFGQGFWLSRPLNAGHLSHLAGTRAPR